jgi:hypothetical protein
MALTIIDRPQGRKLDTTAATATVTSSSGALFTNAGHGLVDGDYIFIDSVYSAYNGYWYVEQLTVNTFQIRQYATATVQAFVNSGTVTYYKSVLTHNWSAVHLPIIYKISSSLWPTNSADTARTVSSISNDSGYVNLNLSGDIKATGSAAELEFVQVFGQNAGIYQIINWISDSDITIDFPYNAGVSFSASTVQYYYNNYHARIKIYAGLNSTHYWAGQKSYEEIAEVSAVPDSTGIITVNISEYIKSKIDVDSNNTSLDTLPNDINSFCQFYISVAEAYTYSNGYTLGTSVSTHTSDQGTFEGYAINAMLPFKTQSGGFMDDYVSGLTSSTTQKFLTPFVQPEIFDGQYFDLAFIVNSNASGFYILEQYLNAAGTVVLTVQTTLTDNDAGVYRFQITYNSAYSKMRVSLYNSSNTQLSETKEIIISPDCSTYYTDLCWKNYLGGHDYWRFNAGKQKSLSTKKDETTTNIYSNFPKSYGKFGETVTKNLSVSGKKSFLIRSQYVTNQQAEDISGIQYALLVQEVTSETNKRTVLVDDGSVNIVEETDKLVEVSVKIRYTDELPVQSL